MNDLHYLSRVCAKQDHMRIKSQGFETEHPPVRGSTMGLQRTRRYDWYDRYQITTR